MKKLKPHNLLVFCFTFFTVMTLSASPDFETVYTKDRYFVTRGVFVVQADTYKITEILMNLEDYSDWALKGLTDEDAETDKLPASLVDIEADLETSIMEVTFNMNSIIRKKGLKTYFRAEPEFDSSGNLTSLVFNYCGEKYFLKDASYTLVISSLGESVQIDYFFRVRLARLVDLFFSLRKYNKNIGFYIQGFTDNLQTVLEQ